MDRLKQYLTLPMAIVIVGGGLCFVGLLAVVPRDTLQWALGANGLVWALIALFARSPVDHVAIKDGSLASLEDFNLAARVKAAQAPLPASDPMPSTSTPIPAEHEAPAPAQPDVPPAA